MDKSIIDSWLNDAKLTPSVRSKLPTSVFCGPGRSFPVPDCNHVFAARKLVNRANVSASTKTKIIACVNRKASALNCDSADETEQSSVIDWIIEGKDFEETIKLLNWLEDLESEDSIRTGIADGHSHMIPSESSKKTTVVDDHDHTVTKNVERTGNADGHTHTINWDQDCITCDELEQDLGDAKLTTTKRKKLKTGTFCGPNRSYPVPDRSHAINALARGKQHASPALYKRIRACVCRKFPGLPACQRGGGDSAILEWTPELVQEFEQTMRHPETGNEIKRAEFIFGIPEAKEE